MLYVCIVSVLQVLVQIQTNQHKQTGICLHQIGGDCWSRMILKLWCLQIHGVWWKAEVVVCVGGFWVEWYVIHFLFESKTVWNQNLFDKKLFYEEVEKQLVVLSFQSVVYHFKCLTWLTLLSNQFNRLFRGFNWLFVENP